MTNYESPWMNEELRMYRKTVREFIQEEFLPRQAKWREQHRPDVEAWNKRARPASCFRTCPKSMAAGEVRSRIRRW